MKGNNIFYMLGQSFKSLWRNGIMTIASITVLMSCLVLIGSFSLLVYNINVNLAEIGSLQEIVVFCDTDADEATVQQIGEQIAAMPNVSDCVFVSKEEALQSERERYQEYAYLLDDLENSNPLPDSYRVTYEDNNEVSALVYQLEELNGVYRVRNRADIAESIENVKNGVSFIFIWFLAILFVVSIFIIINTIKLAVESRHREIAAMRYIGATNFFMTTPFLLEGAIIGLVAAGLAYLIEYELYRYIFRSIGTSYNIIRIIPFQQMSGILAIGTVAIGVFAGMLASRISLNKYMKV